MKTTKEIKADLVTAMKNKDADKKTTLRMLLTTIDKERIRLQVPELNEEQLIACINKEIKAIDSEIEGLVNAGRDWYKQKQEQDFLREYLPIQLTDAEVIIIVNAVVAEVSNIGEAMKILKPQLNGKTDMKQVSALVKAAFLAKKG